MSSLADRAARHFPSQACVAGFQLLAGDRVVLSGVSPDAADADVKSKRARSVRLRRSGEALGVACTCWPTAADVGACKHVWAALLAVDRDGGLDALRTTPKPVVLVPLREEKKEEKKEDKKKVTREPRPSRRSPRASQARPAARAKPLRSRRGS